MALFKNKRTSSSSAQAAPEKKRSTMDSAVDLKKRSKKTPQFLRLVGVDLISFVPAN